MVAIEVVIIILAVGAVSYVAVEHGEILTSGYNLAGEYIPDVTPLEAINNAKQLYEEKITKFQDGTMISHVEQIQQSFNQESVLGIQEQHSTIPVNYTAEQIAQLPPVTQDTPLIPPIPTYIIGYKPFPVIQGYIKIKDTATGEFVKPFIYKALIEISCKSSMEFCALTDIARWQTTVDGGKDANDNDLGGFYYYQWMPTQPTDIYEGLYDTCVSVSSLQKNSYGIYPTNKHCYQIQMKH